MNVEIINPFVKSAIDVIKTMAFTESKPGKPYIKKDNSSVGDVSGLIGLTGEKNSGSFAISFSEGCIREIVFNMLGEKFEEINKDILDAVGEITNMISGGARKMLKEKGYNFKMAIPSIISGKSHIISNITDIPVIVLPFDTEKGPFVIEVCLNDKKSP